MKITKIKAQRRAKRYNIYLDGRFYLGISQDTMVKADLRVNQEISLARLKKLKDDEKKNKAWQKALKYLSFRARSKHEMRDYLAKKKLQEKLIDQTIKRLEKLGQINDQEFVKIWIKDRQIQLKGPRMVYSELIRKGIEKEKIEAGLERWYNVNQERKIAQKAFRKRAGDKRLRLAEKQKILQYLLRRGFSYDIIKEAVK